jgi:ABC-type transport system substrate-binding protein
MDAIKSLPLIVGLIFVLLIGFCLWQSRSAPESNMNLTYVVTETRGPDSFDPNDADKTQNLSVMRMLYATPLEIDRNNLLSSYVLKSFKFDENLKQIRFEIRKGLKYSDGSDLTIEDVALSIARTAYFRPEFPVIKYILGVKEWAASKMGLVSLPRGMKVTGEVLTIELDRKLANPLFRFCLELFSIVPKTCLDLATGKMTCELPPSSGYFTISSKTPEEIQFKRRTELLGTVGDLTYENITFQFKSLQQACSEKIESHKVIAASEIDYVASNCAQTVRETQIHWMPSARFLILRFNPEVALFQKLESRHFFAEIVRRILYEKNKGLIVERSLFPKLLPGYLEPNKLKSGTENLTAQFEGIKIKLPKMKSFGAFIFDAIIEAALLLKMNVEIVPEPPMGEVVDSFLSGEFPVIAGSSGFWAQDPIGDVSMWFTKNLHKPMKFVWSDDKIYQQIDSLESELDPAQISLKMEAFNRHVFEQGLIAPVLHFRRCFISSQRDSELQIPQAITSPAPWHLVVH